ncbi:PREDICTED: uncharacterized protein LOC107085868 [Cyprinodon variegatus]|uniref:uncharacterized protein LOC107085868 n=1 Tax=Cyprinodon variegatus TaxID=28743 RepID=UPI0007429F8D|nr:PREDICTED: uncharacterized protein LOC107085868 [Cyprinodon variegatus]
MFRLLCCCCVPSDNLNERQPLLQPVSSAAINGAESARQAPSAHNDVQTVKRIGKLMMRRVNVTDLDLRFNDMAESFNEQQKHYEAMVEHIRKLKQISGSTNVDNLAFAECIGKIRIEHESTYRVSLKMKGYDFSLVTNPIGPEGENEEKPLCLQSAQSEVMGLSDRAKATISKGTALIQLIDWLLRGHSQMAEQVKGAAENYQEEGRLCDNLEENMKEVRRAKELSQRYRQQAGEVYNEAAQIAGIGI